MNATHPETAPPFKVPCTAGFEEISRTWDKGLTSWSARILPGEFYITRADEVITTVLGSCISACVRDPGRGIGGMNHFMLPEDMTQGKSAWLEVAAGLATRYGSFAMESLINGLLKLGARRDRLEMKLVGGGRVLSVGTDVGARNIAFARTWLSNEGYSVAAKDVGGNRPRRVVYFPRSGKMLVKQLQAADNQEITIRERAYLAIVAKRQLDNDIELF
jgi:chemotaxis protein CheD